MRRFGEAGVTNRKLGNPGTICGLRADGEEFPMEASISQIHLDGQHLYTVILRDITNRVREEATLRRQAELLHLSHDAIFVWSKEGGIHFWSKGATQLYGYESGEVEGIVPEELFKTGFPRPWSQIEAELRERGLWEGELHRTTKTNREVIVSSRLQLVSGSGVATIILETDRDITERRRLEQELLDISGAEQRRIGQDLHDGLCQHLAGIEFRTDSNAQSRYQLKTTLWQRISIGLHRKLSAMLRDTSRKDDSGRPKRSSQRDEIEHHRRWLWISCGTDSGNFLREARNGGTFTRRGT